MQDTDKNTDLSEHRASPSRRSWQKYLANFCGHHKKIALVAGIFFGVLLLLLVIQSPLDSLFSRQKSSSLQAQSIILREINQLPSPESITAGQQNANARAIVQHTNNAVATIRDTEADLSLDRRLSVASWFTTEISSGDLRTLRQAIKSTKQTLMPSLTPYGKSLDVLLLFFEYSPRIDMLEYSPGSSDTNQRMDRLSSGLSETKTSLNSINHEHADELASIIASAQGLQTNLEADGDVDGFVEEFSLLQNQAIEVITIWHLELQSDLRTRINSLNQAVQRTL